MRAGLLRHQVHQLEGSGFRVQGFGFKVKGLRFRVF